MAKKSFTDIFDAARKGTVEDVRYFIEQQGVGINIEDADGWTPLDIAKGRTDSKGNEIAYYLDCAKAKGDSETAKYLDAMRTRPFTKVEQAEIDCFCKAYGNDVHAVDENSEPFLLHEAAAYWSIAVVRYLVMQGADLHAINEGFTPLMSAIAEGASDVWYYLYLESVGAKYHPEGDPHEDLIAFAKEMGNTDVAEFLTNWLDILRRMMQAKDNIRTIVDMAVNAEIDSEVGKWWHESDQGILPIFESFCEFIEPTPEEIDMVRRVKEEL